MTIYILYITYDLLRIMFSFQSLSLLLPLALLVGLLVFGIKMALK